MRTENASQEQAQIMADRLVLMANLAMWDSKKVSPFGRESFSLTFVTITEFSLSSGDEKTRSSLGRRKGRRVSLLTHPFINQEAERHL